VTVGLWAATDWLHKLGFSYRVNTSLEIYHDGHERADVVAARKVFIKFMLDDVLPWSITWTGPNMDIPVKGSALVQVELSGIQSEKIYEIVVHDESTFEHKDGVRMRWVKKNCGMYSQSKKQREGQNGVWICYCYHWNSS
jgi:hypothetical protein